jgi:hypothetical protein
MEEPRLRQNLKCLHFVNCKNNKTNVKLAEIDIYYQYILMGYRFVRLLFIRSKCSFFIEKNLAADKFLESFVVENSLYPL